MVWLIDRLMISETDIFLYFRRFSRTRSEITTVSFSDRPTSVSTAAIELRLNSSPVIENRPTVMITSCAVVVTAASAELPLEAEPHIDQDGDQRDEHGDACR